MKKKTEKLRSFLGLFLCVVMLLSLIPATVIADEGEDATTPPTTGGTDGNEDGDGTDNDSTEEPKVELPAPKIRFLVNGKECSPGDNIEYKPGDEVTLELEWDELPEEALAGLSFDYDLSELLQGFDIQNVTDTNIKKTVDDVLENVIKWSVEGGKLHVEFLEPFDRLEDRKFGVTLKGTIPIDPREEGGEEDKKVKVGEDEFTVTPIYGDAQLKAEKIMGTTRLTDDGKVVSTVTITVKVLGDSSVSVTDIKLTDVMSAPLKMADPSNMHASFTTLKGDSRSLDNSYTLSDLPEAEAPEDQDPPAETESKEGFVMEIEGLFYGGEVITITYDVEITLKDAQENLGKKLENSIVVGDPDEEGEDVELPHASGYLPVNSPSLSKSGNARTETVDGNNKTIIKWTVTFNSGILGDLSKLTSDQIDQLKKLGDWDGAFTLKDTLGEGLVPTEDYKSLFDYSTGKWVLTLDIVKDLNKFTATENKNDGSWTYTLTYETEVVDDLSTDFHLKYGNEAEIDTPFVPGGTIHKGTTTNVPIGFNKNFVDTTFEELEDGKTPNMVWRIKTNMPKHFESYIITDTPQASSTNDKTDYVHQFVPGSIKIDPTGGDNWKGESVKTLYQLAQEWEVLPEALSNAAEDKLTEEQFKLLCDALGIEINTTSLTNGKVGFTFKVLPDKKFHQEMDTNTFTIFFETTAVKDGSNTGSLQWVAKKDEDGKEYYEDTNFYWPNSASLTTTVKNGDDTETISKYGSDYYKHTALPQIRKYAITMSSDNDGTMHFWVRMQGQPIIRINEIPVFNEEGEIEKYNYELDKTSPLFNGGWSVSFWDLLPDNTKIVEGSLYVSLVSATTVPATSSTGKKPETNETFNKLTELLTTEQKMEDGKTYTVFTWESTEEISALLEAYVNNLNDIGSTVTRDLDLVIWYDLRIENYHGYLESHKPDDDTTFTNTIKNGSVNGRPAGGSINVDITFKGMPFLVKTSKYPSNMESIYKNNEFLQTQEDRLNVYFTIDVNPQEFSLENDGIITLEDTMGKSLTPILKHPVSGNSSVKLVNAKTGAVLKGTELTSQSAFNNLTAASFDSEHQFYYICVQDSSTLKWTLKVKAPDATHYTLSYWCEITDEPIRTTPTGRKIFGTVDDGSNEIKVTDEAKIPSSNSTEVEKILIPSAWASGKLPISDKEHLLEVFKFITEGTRQVAADGAVFELVGGHFDTQGIFVPDSSYSSTPTEDLVPEEKWDDAKGYTYYIIPHADMEKYVFCLKEITPPEGCVLDEDDHYFYFSDYYTGTFPKDVDVKELTTADIYEFENEPKTPTTPEPTYGNLSVTKRVTGEAGETDREFHFSVTIGSRVFTFTLKDGETWTSEEFIEGTSYSVEELDANVDDYLTTTPRTAQGTIVGDQTISVTITNHRDEEPEEPEDPEEPEEPGVGSLTVSKTVAGNAGNTFELFHFTVTLSDTDINGVYGEMEFVNGVAEFTLRHGKSKTATGLPAGVTYTVTETEADENGYVTTATGETGTITADDAAVASFTNTRNEEIEPGTGNLIVSKIVGGSTGDRTQDFHFTVTLSDTSINGVYGEMEFVNGVAQFTLKHGESKVARGLPAGVAYEVMELEANQDYYTSVSKGRGEIIPDEASAQATFFNTRGEKLPDDPELEEFDDPEIPLAEWPTDEEPKTGDDSRLGLWVMLMALSMAGFALVSKNILDERRSGKAK